MGIARRRVAIVALVILFTLPLSARAAAAPTLTVTPLRGPANTLFTVEGRNLPPGTTVNVVVFTMGANPAGGTKHARGQQTVYDRPWQVSPDGRLGVPIDASDFAPGDYIVSLPQVPGAPQTTFTVNGMPVGLPATGGGWAQQTRTLPATR